MLCRTCHKHPVDKRIDQTRCPACWALDQSKYHGVSLRAGSYPRVRRKGGKIIWRR